MKVLSEFESKQLTSAYLSSELRNTKFSVIINLEYEPTYVQYNQ